MLLFAGALLAYFLLGGRELFTLEQLKLARSSLLTQVGQAPAAAALVYAGLYAVMVAFSLPVAGVMTIAGGALFGWWKGALLASLASTCGATVAMLGARLLARDFVGKRWPDAVARMDRGVERSGGTYLVTLRLAPAIPFFLINLGMGLTRMPPLRFALLTALSGFPGALVFAYAGQALAKVKSVGDVLSPPLLAAFLGLAILPPAGKWVAGRLARRKALRGFRRPRRFDANLIVVGGGSAGLVASLVAAELKAKVVLIERGAMGGDCLNTGCVPSKSLIRAARAAAEVQDASRFGVMAGELRIDFPAVVRHIRQAIVRIAPNDSVERYRGLGVDVRQAGAHLVDPWTVELDTGERLTGRAILLATGADPVVPPIPGLRDSGFVTSESLWDRLEQMAEPPRRVVVLGGGPIGCELAQAMARLGSQVVLIEQGERLLEREEPEASARVAEALGKDGVQLALGDPAGRVESGSVHTARGAFPYDLLIVALGRRPNLRGLGLEALGIAVDQLAADRRGQGAFGHIFLAGDAAGGPQFTHYAGHSGAIAAINGLLGSLGPLKTDTVVPRVTYAVPEVASVGTLAAAAPHGSEVVRFDVAHNDREIADGGPGGFVRLVVRRGRVLGATIVADHAGELIMPWVMAIKRRIKLGAMLSLIYPYPTLSEVNRAAAGEWRKTHRPVRLLGWAERFHRWRRGRG